MSTSKRLVSLLMALVLMVGVLAVPAFAANKSDDGIEPLSQIVVCDKCGHRTAVVSYRDWKDPMNTTIRYCATHKANCEFYVHWRQQHHVCSDCGYSSPWVNLGQIAYQHV